MKKLLVAVLLSVGFSCAAAQTNDVSAILRRGVAYMEKGDYDLALAEFDKALQLDPRSAHGYSSRGGAYAKKGDFSRAIADHSEAIRLNPDYIRAYKNRAMAYEKIGDKAKAQADREKAAELERRGRNP